MRSLTTILQKIARTGDYGRQACLELTYRCNLRCRSCGLTRTEQPRKSEELATDMWKLAINELVGMKIESFSFIGAEPLLREDLFDLIVHAKLRGGRCTVTTNGLLLDKEKAAAIVSAGLDHLNISIDGPPSLHDEIRRGKDILDKLSAGIACIVKEKREKNAKKPFVHVHTTVSSLNVGYLAEMVGIAEELKANDIQFSPISETPPKAVAATLYNGKPVATERFLPEDRSLVLDERGVEELRTQLRRIESMKKEIPVRARALSALSGPDLLRGTFSFRKCRAVASRVIINPYGDLYPCAHLNYVFGSIKKERIEEIVSGERYRQFLQALNKKLFPVCRHCCNYQQNMSLFQDISISLAQQLSPLKSA
jgi:radical SAM protein with 4Fe4S-binding SPASM domain